MRRSALFARDHTLRREIRRWWTEERIRWVAWLMLNPSNAGELRDDPTALRVTHFTAQWGYGGWVGVNLYPFIASTTDALWDWNRWESKGPEWSIRDDLAANLEDIERVARMASLRVVAFGAQPIERDQPWLDRCPEAFTQPTDFGGGAQLYFLRTSKNRQALHPMAGGKMRGPAFTPPRFWR